MKKIIIAAILLVPVMYACKKDYTCSCMYSSVLNGENYDEDLDIVNGTEADAIAECEAQSDTIIDPGAGDTITVLCNLKL